MRGVVVALVMLVGCKSQTDSGGRYQTLGALEAVRPVDGAVRVRARHGDLRLQFLEDGVLEVELLPDGRATPQPSFAVIRRTSVPATIEEQSDRVVVRGPDLEVVVWRDPVRLSVRDRAGHVLLEDDDVAYGWRDGDVRTWKKLGPDQHFYGFGEKSGHLDKRGTSLVMWNTDKGDYWGDDDPLYQSIPFLLSLEGPVSFGLLLDNTFRTSFDLGKRSRTAWDLGAEAGPLRYYVIAGPTPKQVSSGLAELTGRMPLPPLWSLGYQQCRWSYFPEARVRELARTFRDEKIPCDVIYLDIHYMDGYRSFTWDAQRFPGFRDMVADLAADGFRTVVIIDPGIKEEKGYPVYDQGVAGDHFITMQTGEPYRGKVWPGVCVFPDFVRPETRAWWGGLYQGLVDAGVAGFWNDMNEPAVFDVPGWTMALDAMHGDGDARDSHRRYHNVYGMLMSRATREGLEKLRPEARPFVLTRATFAGGHRYAATWTGDNVSSWHHHAMSIPMVLNMGLSGQAFTGPDIGGFHGAPSPELYARWLQAGVWMPLARTHTALDTRDQEPWVWGEPFTSINRESIEQRYRFLPYLYSQLYQTSVSGWPMARPLFFEFPDDPATVGIEDQFLVGNAVMVAPITSPRAREREVYFPAGSRWYDLATGVAYQGGTRVEVAAPLERTPVFVRAGAVVPTQPVVQHTGERVEVITLEVFPGETVESFLYQDAGDGPSDPHRLVSFYQGDGAALRIEPSGSSAPRHSRVKVRFWDVSAPAAVEVNGASHGAWQYDEARRQLVVELAPPSSSIAIVIR